MSCKKHGDLLQFDNPQTTVIPKVLRSTFRGCNKCSGNYIATESEIYREMKKAAVNSATMGREIIFISFKDGFKNNLSQCIKVCSIHGDMSQWNNPNLQTVQSVRVAGNLMSCLKCTGDYTKSTEEAVELVLCKCKELGFEFIGFNTDDGKFKGASTPCRLRHLNCQEDMSQWKNPVLPQYVQFLDSKISCSKCKGRYIRTEEEVKDEAIEKLNEKNLIFYGFVGEYKNTTSLIYVLCPCCDNCETRSLNQVLAGKSGCKPCTIKSNGLAAIFKNIDDNIFEQLCGKTRCLYYQKWNIENSDEVFYKIGLATAEDVKLTRRYRPEKLVGLSYDILEIIQLPNCLAMLTEFFILDYFKKYHRYQKYLQNMGGDTETFTLDVLEGLTLPQCVTLAIKEIDNLLSLPVFALDEDQKKKAKNKIIKCYLLFIKKGANPSLVPIYPYIANLNQLHPK